MSAVVVLGSLNVDLVVAVERHPAPGETLLGGPLVRAYGGKGANQAVAAAGAGAPTVMIGRVGDDAAGHGYRDRLAALGVDVGQVALDPDAPTGHALIAVDPRGENTIIVSPGANTHLGAAELTALERVISPGDVLLMPLEVQLDVAAAAARAAHARGARVVLNLAPFAPLPADVLALADPVVVNEHEHGLLLAAGLPEPASLLVTLGAEGSRWGSLREAAAPVERVVDTTGAGDAFCGALAARLAAGDEPAAAMTAASAAAGACVAREGAQPA